MTSYHSSGVVCKNCQKSSDLGGPLFVYSAGTVFDAVIETIFPVSFAFFTPTRMTLYQVGAPLLVCSSLSLLKQQSCGVGVTSHFRLSRPFSIRIRPKRLLDSSGAREEAMSKRLVTETRDPRFSAALSFFEDELSSYVAAPSYFVQVQITSSTAPIANFS